MKISAETSIKFISDDYDSYYDYYCFGEPVDFRKDLLTGYLFFGVLLINTSSKNWTFILPTEPFFRTFVMKKEQTWQSSSIQIEHKLPSI